MPKPPVSFSSLAAISLECLHMLDSNYVPCETHRARFTVKSHTFLHIGNILVFKNSASTMCKKKKKSSTEISCWAIANGDLSPAARRVQNLWTSQALFCKAGLVKKRVFHCFVQNRECDWTFISARRVTPITSLRSVRERAEAAYGKNHEYRSPWPETHFWWGVL